MKTEEKLKSNKKSVGKTVKEKSLNEKLPKEKTQKKRK